MAHPLRGGRSRATALGVSTLLAVAACTGATQTSAPSQAPPASAGSPGAAPSGSCEPSGSGAPSGSAGGQIGGQVAVWTAWGGKELETFEKVLQPFQDETGVEVKITTVRDAQQLAINVEAGTTLPDLAGAPTADKIVPWAQDGTMKALEDFLDMESYTAETVPGLVEGGTEIGVVDGKHYMLFVKTQVKNLLWYNTKVFTDEAPATWDDVLAVEPPADARLFCVGLESGADSGWPATDNIEGIVMRQSGHDVYNAWWQGTHMWSSPEIKQAFETFGQMVSEENVYGGPNTVLTTNFGRAGKPLFSDPPGCLFEMQATFVTNFFLEDYPDLQPVDDFDFLPPPSFNSEFDGNIEFFFDSFVMYNDTPQARALMNYLATADAQQIFVDAGGTLAANTGVETFPDPVFEKAAEVVASAERLLVDGSDNMPAEMRTAFYKGILDFTSDPSQLDAILGQLDQVQASAYGQ
jgi:alpha-glucoside transport system substrate-binding protein